MYCTPSYKCTCSTQYTVTTVTQRLPVVPMVASTNLPDLLRQFLSPALNPAPATSPVEFTTVTSLVTHSSTYLTRLTETETTELSLTFRGQPVVTTILDTAVREITATEYSTETVVTSQPVAAAPVTPTALVTAGPASSAVAVQAASPLTTVLTATRLTTTTLLSSAVLPIMFRGRQIETTLVDTITTVLTTTELTTQTVAPSPAPRHTPDLPALAGLPALPGLDIASIISEALLGGGLEGLDNLEGLNELDGLAGFLDSPAEFPVEPTPPLYSLTTIFQSGRQPGQFTRLVSTVFYDEPRAGRSRGELVRPSRAAQTAPAATALPGLDWEISLQSGRNF